MDVGIIFRIMILSVVGRRRTAAKGRKILGRFSGRVHPSELDGKTTVVVVRSAGMIAFAMGIGGGKKAMMERDAGRNAMKRVVWVMKVVVVRAVVVAAAHAVAEDTVKEAANEIGMLSQHTQCLFYMLYVKSVLRVGHMAHDDIG